jgi:rubredoxin
MRLIDANELRESLKIRRDVTDSFADGYRAALIDCIREIDGCTTIVNALCRSEKTERRGRWIDGCCELSCSACGWVYSDELPFMSRHGIDKFEDAFAFCPHCGAKMDGDEHATD